MHALTSMRRFYLFNSLLVTIILFLHTRGDAQDSLIQEFSGLPSDLFYYSSESDFQSESQGIDTTLDKLHYSYLQSIHNYYARTHLGGALNSMVFQGPQFGFLSGLNGYQSYLLDRGQLKYYNVARPYTQISYVLGSKSEQLLSILHSQNITKDWNASLSYNRLSAEGFYFGQNAKHSNFSFTSNYISRENKVGVIAGVVISDSDINENGGLDSAVNFGADLEIFRREAIGVKLSTAAQKLDKKEFFMKGFLNFGELDHPDTNDTSSPEPSFQLSYATQFRDIGFHFKDEGPDSALYDDYFIDSNISFLEDKQRYDWLTNELGFTKFMKVGTDSSLGRASATAGVKHDYIELDQNGTREIYRNLEVNGAVSRTTMSGSVLKLNARYVLDGFNEGDFLLNGHGVLPISMDSTLSGSGLSLGLLGGLSRQTPNLLQSVFNTEYVSWNNGFKKLNRTFVEPYLFWRKWNFRVGAQANLLQNFVYFGTAAVPEQNEDEIFVGRVYLRKCFNAGIFFWKTELIYQTTSNEDIVRIPELISNNSLYMETPMFHKALLARLGFDVYYNTAYKADAYMPLSREFYLQNETEIGNYPYIDFYAVLKIKSARIFFKVEHINSDLMGSDYFTVQDYPMAPRTIKLGINWAFLN